MKKFLLWLIIICFIGLAGYFTLIPLLPGEILILKRASGQFVKAETPGLYIHIPFKEQFVKYPLKEITLELKSYIKKKDGSYKVNALVVYSITDPEKLFPHTLPVIEKKIRAEVTKTILNDHRTLPQIIMAPVLPHIPGLLIEKIRIFHLVPLQNTTQKAIQKMSILLKEEIERINQNTQIMLKKIETEAKVKKEKIIQIAELKKKKMLNESFNMENKIVSQLRFPELWFLLKKVNIYSKAGTNTTLYLPLPLNNNLKRR